MTERMECPSCGYKCTPQWLNDEAHCLKCQQVLRRRQAGAGTGAGYATNDASRRQVGEASTFKTTLASGDRAFEGGTCSKSPSGAHQYKFGKCSHCQAPEPSGGGKAPARAVSPRPAAPAPEKKAPSKSCSKCNRPYSGHGDTCGACRGMMKKQGSSQQCGQCGGFYWGFAEVCEDCTPSYSASLPPVKEAKPSEPRGGREKVECPFCGYKCVPQWLNDKAHCLKCQAVLKIQDTVHGNEGGRLHETTQRQAGEVSTFKHNAASAMESQSGVCSVSPTGSHHWKFGKCEHCGKAEGVSIKAPGAVANPGGAGGCSAGGKCIYKFAKCSKCGKKEY